MSISKGFLITGLLALVGCFCLLGAGCNDDPTGPKPAGPRDYAIYITKYGDDSTYFAYHTESEELDTFYVPGPKLYDLDVSARGSKLFLCYLDFVRIVDTRSFSVLAELPYRSAWDVAVSPDNQRIALHGGGFRIIALQDYSVEYIDTLPLRQGEFSARGERYYAPMELETGPAVFRLDFEDNLRVSHIPIPDEQRIIKVIPSVDERLLFMYRALGSCYWGFEVYDVALDSLVFTQLVAPGCGDMAVSRDGRSVYLTGPGDLHGWPPPAYSYAVYDIQSMTMDSLTYWSVCNFPDSTGFIGGSLGVTPDSRIIFVSESVPGSRLLIQNVDDRSMRLMCIEGASPSFISCQNAP